MAACVASDKPLANNGGMAKSKTKLQSVNFVLSSLLGLLFLAYCVVYLCACPSLPLACAVAAELFAFVVSVVVIKSGVFTLPEKCLCKIPQSIRTVYASIMAQFERVKLCLLGAISSVVLLDFVALCLSLLGLYGPAIALYTCMPVTYWVGLHPAFTLEMLAGALVQNRNYERAEPLFLEVKSIRVSLAGADSDLASAIYADLGDLKVRRNDLPAAEKWYRRSVAVGPRTGRASTGLATVLRELGNYSESEHWYRMALARRKQVYGEQSKQYADTMRGYLALQAKMGRHP